MRGRLPALTAREVVRALQRLGFEVHHQTGSHLTLRSRVSGRKVVVPMHRHSLRRRTLFQIIQQAGVSRAEFQELL